MKKIIALVLSLMLLIGCVGSAEIEQGTLNVTFMGDQLVNATIARGYDADGCETVSVDAAAMGNVISAMAQLSDTGITIASGDQAYSFTIQNVAKAVDIISEKLGEAYGISVIPASVSELLPVIMAYNAEDVATIENVLVNEVNRFMNLCLAQGIVTIAEDGTLTVQAEANDLVAVMAAYLNELAADETALPTLAATGMWTAAGLPDAATCAQYVSAIAEQISQMTSENTGVTCRLYLVVEPTGSVSGEFTYAAGENSIAAQFGYSAEAINIAYDLTLNGSTVSYNYVLTNGHFSLYESFDGMTYAGTIDLNEDGTAVDVTYKVDMGEGMQVDVAATVNADYSFTAVVTVNGVEYDAQGLLNVWDNAYEYSVKVTSGNELLCGYTAGISVNVYEDQGTVYSLYLQDDVAATTMYMAQLTINGYSVKLALSEGENVVFEAEGGITAMDDNNFSAYVECEGIRFVLTAACTDTAMMASLDYGIAGDETGTMYNLAILNASLVDENTLGWELTYNGMTYNGTVYYNANELNAYATFGYSMEYTDENGAAQTLAGDLGAIGIKGNGDNQLVLYVIEGDMEYDLTLTMTQYENGIGLNGSLDLITSDSTDAQNVGTVDVTYSIADGDMAHISGTELSGEDLATLVLTMMGVTGTETTVE